MAIKNRPVLRYMIALIVGIRIDVTNLLSKTSAFINSLK